MVNAVLAALERRGWDVAGLARAIGSTRWRASKILHGIARPRPCERAAIAGVLGVELVAVVLDMARAARGRGPRAGDGLVAIAS